MRTRPFLCVVIIPARSSVCICASAAGSVIPKGSANFESDIAPPRARRANIRRRSGRPRASSIRRTFLRASPGVNVRRRTAASAIFCVAFFLARFSRSLTRFIRRGFQYFIIDLSIGVGSAEVKGTNLRADVQGVCRAIHAGCGLYFKS